MSCNIHGCPKPVRARGLCSLHYQRERRKKGTEFLQSFHAIARRKHDKSNTCWLGFCMRKIHSMNLCRPHYLRLRRYRLSNEKWCSDCPNDDKKCEYTDGLCAKHYSARYGHQKRHIVFSEDEKNFLMRPFLEKQEEHNEFLHGAISSS